MQQHFHRVPFTQAAAAAAAAAVQLMLLRRRAPFHSVSAHKGTFIIVLASEKDKRTFFAYNANDVSGWCVHGEPRA